LDIHEENAPGILASRISAAMHLTKLALPKTEVAQYAKTRGFSQRLMTNYLVHSVMAEAFSGCPSPFDVQDKGHLLRILFYSDEDADALHSHAQVGASPEAYEAIRWDERASKPMPDPFPMDMTLQFEVRACPVIRKASAGEGKNADGERRTWEEGDELDAFLARQWTSDNSLSREEVYCDWLERQFRSRGSAEPQAIAVGGFTLTEMTRRGGGDDRSVKTIQRPDVTLEGKLQITDGKAFTELLRSGLGRHKSFGYGMLKVRPD